MPVGQCCNCGSYIRRYIDPRGMLCEPCYVRDNPPASVPDALKPLLGRTIVNVAIVEEEERGYWDVLTITLDNGRTLAISAMHGYDDSWLYGTLDGETR